MSEVEPTMEDLRAEVERTGREYRDAKLRLHDAEVAAAPFAVGDEVEARRHPSDPWARALVRVVEPKSWGDAWYRVSFAKKDGDWSKRVVWVGETVRVPLPASEEER